MEPNPARQPTRLAWGLEGPAAVGQGWRLPWATTGRGAGRGSSAARTKYSQSHKSRYRSRSAEIMASISAMIMHPPLTVPPPPPGLVGADRRGCPGDGQGRMGRRGRGHPVQGEQAGRTMPPRMLAAHSPASGPPWLPVLWMYGRWPAVARYWLRMVRSSSGFCAACRCGGPV